MPKKSITLNGFGGGLNKDADLSDLKSEGRGKDEVSFCKNLFLDERGKIVAKYPTVIDEDPSGDIDAGGVTADNDYTSNEADPRKLIISNNRAYMNLGVYASQNKVNWSGNPDFFAPTPYVGQINDSNPDAHSTGIDIDVETDLSGDLNLFLGRNATFNSTGKAVVINKTGADTIVGPAKWMKFMKDKNRNGKVSESATYWNHTGDASEERMYELNNTVSTSGTDVIFYDDVAAGYVDFSSDSATLDGDDMDNLHKIQFYHKYDNDTGWAMVFRGGKTNFDSGNELDGFQGKYYENLDNRDIRLELKTAFGSDMAAGDMDVDYLYIWYDCGGTGDMEFDYAEGTVYDERGKIWRISKSDLIGYGTEDGYVVIDLDWASAIHTGPLFSPSTVKMIAIGLFQPDTSGDWNADDSILRIKEFSIVENVTSLWDNSKFAFYQTGINANGMESLPMRYGTTGGDDIVEGTQYPFLFRFYQPHTRWVDKGKVYYQELDNIENPRGEKLLLAEWDYTDGVKVAGRDDFVEWDADYNDGTDTQPAYDIVLPDPVVSSTYTLESGYPSGVDSIHALFKTSAVVGRTVYIGNVSKQVAYTTITAGGSPNQFIIEATGDYFQNKNSDHPNGTANCNWETHGFGINQIILMEGATTQDGLYTTAASGVVATVTATNDRLNVEQTVSDLTQTSGIISFYGFSDTFESSLILKGAPGKVGGFPDNMYIDLDLGSESIQVMEGVGDRLFVFSENQLLIVNVAQDIEFLEASMLGYGAKLPRQVTRVNEGLALINSTGVHYFDGEKFTDLTLGKLDSVPINPDVCAIMYDTNRKMLWCWFDSASTGAIASGGGIFFYSFASKSWVGNMEAETTGIGAAIDDPGSNSFIGEDGKAWFENSTNLFSIGTSVSDTTADRDVQLETGRISCGNIARNKRFYKVHVTVAVESNMQMYWKTDVSGSYSSAIPLTTNDGLNTLTMTGAKGKWIQLKFANDSGQVKPAFEISDISLTYREKTLK